MTLVEFLLARFAEDEARIDMMRSGWPHMVQPGVEPPALARIEANRQLVERADLATLRELAAPYANHPDWRPEWTTR